MGSIFDGSFADDIAAALADANVPRAGVLRHVVWGVDEIGQPVIVGSTDHPFGGWRENYSTLFAAQSAIPTQDVRIVVIAKTCAVTPAEDDYIQIGGVWHRVRNIEGIDPAGATVNCQCFESEPA